MERAQKICHKANLVLSRMFADVKDGRVVDTRAALPAAEAISNSVALNQDAIVAVARQKIKGDYATMHGVAVSALMAALSAKMGMEPQDRVRAALAGLLMDLGVASLTKGILSKPAAFSDSEMDLVKGHSIEGVKLLSKSPRLPEEVRQACLAHHERFDGSGYPNGLAGEQIPQIARMAALCDVYDAITSDRPHKRGATPSEAMRAMAEMKPKFDAKIFGFFVKTLGIYPIGSLVKLESGRLTVVVEQGKGSLLHPVVKVFYSIERQERFSPERMVLGPGTDKILGKEDPAKYNFGELDAFWLFS